MDFKEHITSLLRGDKINKEQAIAAGILLENIYVSDIDTYVEENLYSYRRDKTTGRAYASIMQKS